MNIADKRYALPMGTELGEGEVVFARLLYAGESGFTYKCVHRNFEKPIAIKEVFPQDAVRTGVGLSFNSTVREKEFEQTIEGFLHQERRIVGRSSHQNIVSIFGMFGANSTAYVLTEYIQAETLYNRIDSGDTLSHDEVQRIALALFEVLEVTHREKSFHGKVSPGNVVLAVDGRIVLNDCDSVMGLALDGALRNIPTSDIFNLGVTLYQALSGDLPTSNGNGKNFKDISNLDAPRPFLDAIRSATESDEEDRPSTVAEFREIWLGGRSAPSKKTREQKRILRLEAELQRANTQLETETRRIEAALERLEGERKAKEFAQEQLKTEQEEKQATGRQLAIERQVKEAAHRQLKTEQGERQATSGQLAAERNAKNAALEQVEIERKAKLKSDRHLIIFIVTLFIVSAILILAIVFFWVDLPRRNASDKRLVVPSSDPESSIATTVEFPSVSPTIAPTRSLNPTSNNSSPESHGIIISRTEIHAGPSTNFPSIGVLQRNDKISPVALHSNGYWLKLADDQWIQSWNVNRIPPNLPTVQPTPIRTGQVPTRESNFPFANAVANLRAGPGIDFQIVGGLAVRERVYPVSIAPDGLWLKLSNDAWVYSQLIENIPLGLPVESSLPVPPPPSNNQNPSHAAEEPATGKPVPSDPPSQVRGDWSLPVERNVAFLMPDGLEVAVQDVIYQDQSRMQSYIERRAGQDCEGCLAIELEIVNRSGNAKEYLAQEDFKLLKGGPNGETFQQVRCQHAYGMRSMANPGSLKAVVKGLGLFERTLCFVGVTEISTATRLVYSPVFLYEGPHTPTPTPDSSSLKRSTETREIDQDFRTGWSVYFMLMGI